MAQRKHKSKKDRQKQKKRNVLSWMLIITVALVAVLVVVMTNSPQPQPMQCFSNGTQFQVLYTARIFIWNGAGETSFIRVPLPLPYPSATDSKYFTTGIFPTCRYPITVEGITDYGPNYTTIHIQSPYVHSYTLGDFFYVWSKTIGTNVYFGPDGVASVSGRTVVQYNFGPEQTASPTMVIHTDDWITIRVYPQ